MSHPHANMLGDALSPYLLQHRNNPVHWRQWGDAALEEARDRGCPILLSIGYAACHWCHVMAHESFEDEATARLMNELFVNIKVDREERPDIDQIYMAALQAMGEQGGWPLTIFLTPQGEPFWGGTYFPPEPRYGRPSFRQVLAGVADLYANHRERVANNTAALRRHLQKAPEVMSPSPQAADLDAAAGRLLSAVDPVNGGIGSAPKFPSAAMWEGLWRLWLRSGDPQVLAAANAWLTALCQGGIYDHLGGGIHRYTVDERWLVPHFEKMLYDNALFIRSLSLAYRQSNNALFRIRIEETIACLLRDFRQDGGGFAASFDADSEGSEGLYYTWTAAEVDAALGDAAAEFAAVYDVTQAGNWEHRTILNRLSAATWGEPATEDRLRTARDKLLAIRSARVPPACDDKILTDWNALLVRALVDAGRALDRPDWIAVAAETMAAIERDHRAADGRLMHARRGDRLSGPALACDHAACLNAAIALHAATGAAGHLEAARAHAEALEAWHADGQGGYYQSASDRTDVVLRQRADQDDAIPSANAQALEGLVLLGLLDDDAAITERAARAADAAWARVAANPFASFGILNALDTALDPQKLVVTGPETAFRPILREAADPARLDLRATDLREAARLTGGQATPGTQEAAAYLCRGPVCLPAVHDDPALRSVLRPKPAGRSG